MNAAPVVVLPVKWPECAQMRSYLVTATATGGVALVPFARFDGLGLRVVRFDGSIGTVDLVRTDVGLIDDGEATYPSIEADDEELFEMIGAQR